MCKNCTIFVGAVTQLERKLLAQEAAIQKADEVIVRQIADILNQPDTTSQDEDQVIALIGKLLSDEKRVRRLTKDLRRYQKRNVYEVQGRASKDIFINKIVFSITKRGVSSVSCYIK